MKSKRIQWMIALLVCTLLLTGCTKKKEEMETEAEREEETGEKIDTIAEEPVYFRAPFSGVMIEEESDKRPVLVTINNDPKARPQSGLNEAEIVYEFMTEGMTTRFLALYQNELPDKIGPVRSARDMFIHLAKGLDAFYVAHGYSPDAHELLQQNVVDHINGMQHDGTLFKRSTDRFAPHNSYVSAESIELGAEHLAARMTIEKMPHFTFYEELADVPNSEEAVEFTILQGSKPHFTSNYLYNEPTGTYERSVNNQLTMDKESEETTTIANVLVFETKHETIDALGRQRIDLTSGGKGLVFQAGVMEEIEWENQDGFLMPVKNGKNVSLVPGKTWIHIVRPYESIDHIVSLTP